MHLPWIDPHFARMVDAHRPSDLSSGMKTTGHVGIVVVSVQYTEEWVEVRPDCVWWGLLHFRWNSRPRMTRSHKEVKRTHHPVEVHRAWLGVNGLSWKNR